MLHSSSDERFAIERYFERGFRYDTIAQFLEKKRDEGPSVSRLIITITISSNVIDASAALHFTDHSVQL